MVQVKKYKGGSFYDPICLRLSTGEIVGGRVRVLDVGFRIVIGVINDRKF